MALCALVLVRRLGNRRSLGSGSGAGGRDAIGQDVIQRQRPRGGEEVGLVFDAIAARGVAGPGEGKRGANCIEVSDAQGGVRVARIGVREILLHVGFTIAIRVACGGEDGQAVRVGMGKFVGVGDAIAVGVRAGGDGVGLHEGGGAGEVDPAAICGIARGLEVNPANVRAICEAAQLRAGDACADEVAGKVHTKVRSTGVPLLDAIRRRAVAEADPAAVRALDGAGADILADDRAISPIAAPVQSADVRAAGKGVRGVNRRGRLKARGS